MSEATQQSKTAFDPAKTMLLIAAWPDRLVAPELIIWAMVHRIRRIQWYSKRYVECAYNEAVKTLALASDCEHFIFADHDVRPEARTAPFLTAAGPLVACEYDLSTRDKPWDDPQAMHTGLWRCDRKVLEAIAPPWFQRVLTPDGTGETQCVCLYFRDKARAAGFPVVRAGWVGHDPH